MSESGRTTVRDLTLTWASEVLGDPEVTSGDNFVDLGGHSILALRMNRYARERLGVEYDLMILLESPLGDAAEDLAGRLDPVTSGGAAP